MNGMLRLWTALKRLTDKVVLGLEIAGASGGVLQSTHLLNAKDNERVTIHELRGFISNDLTGALTVFLRYVEENGG